VRYAVILLLLLAMPLPAAARTLTLEQALAIALEKNRDIAKAGEYARYVNGKYVEERSAALPQLGLNGSVAVLRDNGQPSFVGGGTNQYDNYLGLSLSQPLYTWGKIGAAIRAAEIGMNTATEQLRLAQQAARRDVTAAFSNLLLAGELLRLANENLQQKQRHSSEAHTRFATGVATDYDVLAADVALANARPEVIKGENRLRLARERLRFLLAEDEAVDAVGTLEPQVAKQPAFDEVLAAALARRPEMLDLGLRIGVYTELVTIAAADDKPRLDLKGGAGWHQLEFAGIRSDGASWNVGVSLSFPFFDGMKSRGRVEQARSDLATKEIEKKQLLDSIRLEARTALSDLQEAAEILTALAGTVKQAERLLQMAEKGYEYGVKIRLEVDDAQTNLLQAQTNRARAASDYLVAKVNLEWVMGRLGE
jgi:HAE1 family hydrophobic/amphiphilic exporter-1